MLAKYVKEALLSFTSDTSKGNPDNSFRNRATPLSEATEGVTKNTLPNIAGKDDRGNLINPNTKPSDDQNHCFAAKNPLLPELDVSRRSVTEETPQRPRENDMGQRTVRRTDWEECI